MRRALAPAPAPLAPAPAPPPPEGAMPHCGSARASDSTPAHSSSSSSSPPRSPPLAVAVVPLEHGPLVAAWPPPPGAAAWPPPPGGAAWPPPPGGAAWPPSPLPSPPEPPPPAAARTSAGGGGAAGGARALSRALLAAARGGASGAARLVQSGRGQIWLAALAALAALAIQVRLYREEVNPAVATVTVGTSGLALSHIKFGPRLTARALAALCVLIAAAFTHGSLRRSAEQIAHDLDAISDGPSTLPPRIQLLAAVAFPLLLMSGAAARHGRSGDTRELWLPWLYAALPFSCAFAAFLWCGPPDMSPPDMSTRPSSHLPSAGKGGPPPSPFACVVPSSAAGLAAPPEAAAPARAALLSACRGSWREYTSRIPSLELDFLPMDSTSPPKMAVKHISLGLP
ncbi:hypothetical protein EMIHUDRAFT_119766 [Emiliania huxleyi CCMP1516]|uniref:Uncharacterized protein n=2 Tax=Emiliania huxleyi TaxID=2903 RepID=A0A0D3IQZ8_EMIH1|nr:hypothetical protein EMIHUDRAFT_119766 [Emiliania huxleyi CCMP1516]EOD13683.1 hypothetical protein EMIHUDRAFT_119766 [Emiliania huxleyi CCMP1516]|eukprot:XP_005766112.1 hypothetical protein EMIHUDRAFT_119766 [Emiliania huxleyi CCMP1516]